MSSPQIDSGALLEDLAGLQPGVGGHTCRTAHALGQIPEDVRRVALAALDNPVISSTALCKVLNKHGFQLTTGQVSRHRRRGTPNGCKCPQRVDGGGV
jgi:hypothetical protein